MKLRPLPSEQEHACARCFITSLHPVDRAGVKKGGVIIGYGSQIFPDIDDLDYCWQVDENAGLPLVLTFLRRGEK